MLKNEKGILLVPLVLVIIILMIIGGVAVSVAIQNADGVEKNSIVSSSKNATTPFNEAQTKVKLIFELCEANYQTELAKGNVISREDVFTASTLVNMLNKYNIDGNTVVTLGTIDLISGVTVNYGNEYTFLVRVSNGGVVTVIKK